MITVRKVVLSDAERIREIYGHYVKNTAVSFEYEIPSVEELTQRIQNTIKFYPYFVAEENGDVKGYAYASPFVGRAAYICSCELSVYVEKGAVKSGIGRKLYDRLEKALGEIGITNLYACIAYPDTSDEYLNFNSVNFHKHMGFEPVGHFHHCAEKFGRRYNMLWAEKIIGKTTAVSSAEISKHNDTLRD